MPSFGDRKKWDQTLVLATHAGRIAWVMILFALCLSRELSWNALLFCHFSLVYIPPAPWFGSQGCPCRSGLGSTEGPAAWALGGLQDISQGLRCWILLQEHGVFTRDAEILHHIVRKTYIQSQTFLGLFIRFIAPGLRCGCVWSEMNFLIYQQRRTGIERKSQKAGDGHQEIRCAAQVQRSNRSLQPQHCREQCCRISVANTVPLCLVRSLTVLVASLQC